MYKCMNCGNSEKFIGIANEKGTAIIERDYCHENKKDRYSWIYFISDKKWESEYKVMRCFYCNSSNIKIF